MLFGALALKDLMMLWENTMLTMGSIEIQNMTNFTLSCKLNQCIEDDSKHGINNEIEIDRKKFNVTDKFNFETDL